MGDIIAPRDFDSLSHGPGPLTGFLPQFRRRRLRSTACNAATVERHLAVVLRLDIAGFTALTDHMVAGGVVGAEELANTINQCVRRIADIADDSGGDLATLAGDAAFLVWLTGETLDAATATLLATQAALQVQTEATEWQVAGTRIRFRASICAGELDYFELGGLEDEWHGVLLGPAVADVVALGQMARPDQTLLSTPAWMLVRERCQGVALARGYAEVERVTRPVAASAATAEEGGIPTSVLNASVPQMVRSRLAGGPSHWAGEFRTVSVVFVGLKHPPYARSQDALIELQTATRLMQDCAQRFGGAVHQIRADEEGLTVIATFGLPPHRHEDDPIRAVRAALAIHRESGDLRVTTSTGVATGRVFCTVFGSERRRIFSLVGPAMNLGARLMQAHTGVVCDGETARIGRQQQAVTARELAARVVKGKAEPVVAYAPSLPPERRTLKQVAAAHLFGRDRELGVLTKAVAQLQLGQGGVVVIEGEPGAGKTALAKQIIAIARANAIHSVVSLSEQFERDAVYSAWREVFRDLFAPAGLSDGTVGAPATMLTTPLLADAIGVSVPDNEQTASLSGEARATATRRLLVQEVAKATKKRPLFLALEDAHLFDSGSWSLLEDVAAAQLPALVVVTTRPDPQSSVYERVLAMPGCARVVLHGLGAEDSAAVLSAVLGVRTVSAEVAALVVGRTGGNPFFIEELAPILRDHGIVSVADAAATLAGPGRLADADLDRVLKDHGVPSTVEGAIVARYDGIDPRLQLLLRAASVIGRSFERAELAAILPSTPPPDISEDLKMLIRLGFISNPVAEDRCEFRHSLIRDVIYNATSFSERRTLHGELGRWIEQRVANGAVQVDALLGHHFCEAGDKRSARRYLTRAAEAALKAHANVEAARLLSNALAFDPATDETAVDKDQVSHLELLLGQAHRGDSQYRETREHTERGLELAGFRSPSTQLAVVRGILAQGALQLTRRLSPRERRSAAPRDRQIMLDAAGAFEGLVETYFYLGDGLRSLHAALRALNLAERAGGSSPELARCYATFGGVVGFARMRRAARNYGERALATSRAVSDPHAALWVSMVVGISSFSVGDWTLASTLFKETAALAERLGDRRRWRDGKGNLATVAICRGDWEAGLDFSTEVRAVAVEDKDSRYDVLGCREQAYCLIQLGRFHEVDPYLERIEAESRRGLKAEEAATLQDLHALAGTLALERGDEAQALEHANQAMRATEQISSMSSFPNAYRTTFLIARLFINLAAMNSERSASRAILLKNAAKAVRALKHQAGAHLIAGPSYLLSRGLYEWARGRRDKAGRLWIAARDRADRLEMPVEGALAQRELSSNPGAVRSGPKPFGLPLRRSPLSP